MVKTAAELKGEVMESITGIVGPAAVSDDAGLLQGYASGLASGAQGQPFLAVRPADAKQVQAVVRLANQVGLNLVPVSSGEPRMRGDSVPAGEAVMVDLSAMNRIVRMDRRNKVAIIEPGVTFEQLKSAAAREGLKVFTPLLPRPQKSVIASYLEREPILTPKFHWDMTDPMLCTELVFGTGDLFRTGSAAGPGSLEDQWKMGIAQKNPTGPAHADFMRVVQGAQGTMAMVTWASVKLELLPQARRLYFVTSDSLNKLVDFSYRVNRVKLADEFLILNASALANILEEDAGKIGALAAAQAPYTAIYCVAGYQYFPEKRVEYEEKDISDIAQATGLTIKREIPGASARRMMEVLDGPSPEPYWKLRAKGSFREIFFLTTMDKTQGFISLMEDLALARGYPVEEMAVYIQPIQQGRSCHLEFNFFCDPADGAGTAAAEALCAEAAAALADAGAFFSRPYGAWADLAYKRCPDSVKALRMVKDILDPAGVLNRGKLCFGEV